MGAAEVVDFFFSCVFRAEPTCSPGQDCLYTQIHMYVCVCVCVCGCGCVVPEVGGWALVVIKRWNINATLPLISFHLSSSCPLCARLS